MENTTKSDFIECETWFHKNIDPKDLKDYIDEKTFCNTIHEKFNNLSYEKLVIGAYEKFI